MSVIILDGPTLEEIVNDSEAFSRIVDDHFNMLDEDGDGVLSRGELRNRGGKVSRECELQSQEEIESLYDAIFDKFDIDRNGAIDREQFRALAREIMSAKAQGIGNLPVSIIVQGDSLLLKAVEHKG